MKQGIWFDRIQEQSFAVLVENGRVVELMPLDTAAVQSGDIYRARIDRIEPSLQAAFVPLGSGKNGFLPLNVVANESLRAGDIILVQVKKEAAGGKGPLLTTELKFPSQNLVFVYGTEGLWFSRKSVGMAEAKESMRRFASAHLKMNEGLLVRTAGLAQKDSVWKNELEDLRNQCRKIVEKKDYLPVPKRLYQQNQPWEVWLEQSHDESFQVWVSDQLQYELIKSKYGAQIAVHYVPEDSIRYHQRLWLQLKEAFQKTVLLPSGGNLIIEPTEALTVVDVNSAQDTREEGQQKNAFVTNAEAAEALAIQLRLRNLSGMIIVDFIKMNRQSQRKLAEVLKNALREDPNEPHFVGFTTLGLAELTRKRKKRPLHELNAEFQRLFY